MPAENNRENVRAEVRDRPQQQGRPAVTSPDSKPTAGAAPAAPAVLPAAPRLPGGAAGRLSPAQPPGLARAPTRPPRRRPAPRKAVPAGEAHTSPRSRNPVNHRLRGEYQLPVNQVPAGCGPRDGTPGSRGRATSFTSLGAWPGPGQETP
jgi:hypothetical protein